MSVEELYNALGTLISKGKGNKVVIVGGDREANFCYVPRMVEDDLSKLESHQKPLDCFLMDDEAIVIH